jgi:hypothetical protein
MPFGVLLNVNLRRLDTPLQRAWNLKSSSRYDQVQALGNLVVGDEAAMRPPRKHDYPE